MKRITIRADEHRGQAGFTVSTGPGVWNAHIFCRTREGAEVVRDAVYLRAKADEAIDTILKEGR